MISPAVLEQPGRWRTVGITFGLALAVAPAVSLLWPAFLAGSPESTDALGSSFGNALARSLLVAAGAAGLSFLIGLPTGVFAGLYEFPARRLLLGALAIPLLVPSFLWAIGLSMLRIRLGLSPSSFFSGATGCILAFSSLGLPLVVYASFAAMRTLSKGQVDAARLAGGERVLVRYASRSALGVAALAAMLAGVVALSDPGPGQILGYPEVATQVLTSFSALYDFGLAARQALALAGIVLLITLPLAWLAAPRLASGLLARDVAHAPLQRTRVSATVGPAVFVAVILLTSIVPLVGLTIPVLHSFPLSRAWSEVSRTAGNTLIYAMTAGIVAAALGTGLAMCAGREPKLRGTLLAALLVLFSLPPSLGALGLVQTASAAPSWSDPLLRSRLTVGGMLALRFLPVAALLVMRRFGTLSPSWAQAAAVHGVPLSTYLWRVVAPTVRPMVLLAVVLVALLASADAGTVLLLQPPGESSLSVTIFTVMANAPESLVAALCLMYVLGGGSLLVLGWAWSGRAIGAHPAGFE